MTTAIAIGFLFIAATMAMMASRSQLARDRRRVWFAISAVQMAFAIELVARTRLLVGAPFRSIFLADGLYQERRLPQAIAIVVLAALFFAIGSWSLRSLWLRRHSGSVLIAAAASLCTIFIFLVEAVSLHQVDAVFDRSLGPFHLYGLLWIGSALVVSVAALIASGD
jgi:hypothetical protein